jgi:hypothetical protein
MKVSFVTKVRYLGCGVGCYKQVGLQNDAGLGLSQLPGTARRCAPIAPYANAPYERRADDEVRDCADHCLTEPRDPLHSVVLRAVGFLDRGIR